MITEEHIKEMIKAMGKATLPRVDEIQYTEGGDTILLKANGQVIGCMHIDTYNKLIKEKS